MRLAWLQDLCPWERSGGAQLTDRAHMVAGIRRGHDINLVTPAVPDMSMDVDAVVISNATAFGLNHLERFVKEKPAIWFFHDYWPCKWRLYYPMVEKCKACYLRERWVPLFQASKLAIWLSPLHREAFLYVYPELEAINYVLCPSPVDGKAFRDLGLAPEERQGLVAIESLHDFKGRRNVIAWAEEHPEEQIDCIGGNQYPNAPLPRNIRYTENIPNWELNEFLNHHRALLHLPQSPSPFDRTTAEAYLAGCAIVGNQNIGALSYPWWTDRESVRSHLEDASRLFWFAIETGMKL